MVIERLFSENAPEPKGFYSQAVKYENLIFTSGQLPIDPQSGESINDSIENQVIRVLKNIQSILEDNNSSIEKIIKVTIFIRNIKDWEIVNCLYKDFFKSSLPPARSIIAGVDINRNLDIEMEVIAYIS